MEDKKKMMEDKKKMIINANKKTSLTEEQIKNKRAMFTNPNSNRERRAKSDSSKLSGQFLDKDIYTSKILTPETQKVMSNMEIVNEVKKLKKMKSMGCELSKEQRDFLEQNSEQIHSMQIEYRNRQNNRKDKGHGMEM